MWLVMQSYVVISKHRDKPKAIAAARRFARKCERLGVTRYPYFVAQLRSPGHWERGDGPAQSYVIRKDEVKIDWEKMHAATSST